LDWVAFAPTSGAVDAVKGGWRVAGTVGTDIRQAPGLLLQYGYFLNKSI